MTQVWIARFLIGLVFFFNVQCALSFLVAPGVYVTGFDLSGASGEALVRGFGLLFLMWNVPYAVALWHPLQQRTALIEAIVMQAIAFFGESALLWLTPVASHTLQTTVSRFIGFDGVGMALLLLALWFVYNKRTSND
jgi:hypothetical protein